MHRWLEHVETEENKYSWEYKSGPISRHSPVEHSISFERVELPVPSVRRWFPGESVMLLPEAGNILIDAAVKSWLDFKASDKF